MMDFLLSVLSGLLTLMIVGGTAVYFLHVITQDRARSICELRDIFHARMKGLEDRIKELETEVECLK